MKSVLITGASSGFGMNVALELAQLGWKVFASMRDLKKGKNLQEQLIAKHLDDQVTLIELDVTSSASIELALRTVLQSTNGSLDALLNNAGYSILGAFEDMSDEDCRRQMETNFFGTLAVTRAVLPIMRKARRGRIVLTSSNSVNTPHPILSIYAASKWALEGWAEGLAMEVAPFGIGVVVVQPGAHRTPFAEHVVPIVPADSAYKRWLDQAAAGLANLDKWGRDGGSATAAITQAVIAEQPAFRTQIGEDSQVFSALKGAFPYEVRAWAVRAIVGLPNANAFVDNANIDVGVPKGSTGSEVVNAVINSLTSGTALPTPSAQEAATLISRLSSR
jgi:NAD(P)-dependent dehydrogenase (short-subunit alcohol dehydrogenase family)